MGGRFLPEGITVIYDLMIGDMRVGDEFEGFYILKMAQGKISNSGKPYLNAALSDASGEIDAKVWDYPGPIGAGNEGSVVKVRGAVSEYRGSLQVTLDRLRLADERDTYELSRLVPVAPIDVDAAMEKVREYVKSIEDGDLRALVEAVLEKREDVLRSIPAGKSVHHSFVSGLLMHTLNMLRQADFLSELYADTVDRSLLMAGTCLHDLGKGEEFVLSQLGLVTDYSVKGQLIGHLAIAAQYVSDAAKRLGTPEEKSVLLQHLLLSHHGEPEFGAVVRPMCAEAEILSFIDLIDSRMEIYRENLEKLEIGQFSQRIFALDKKIYRHG